MATSSPPPQMSQMTSFLIFLAAIFFTGPFLYIIFTKTLFIASPDWFDRFLTPAIIGSAVVALLSVPLFLRGAKAQQDAKRRWSLIIMGPICVAALIMSFVIFSLPFVLAKISPEPTFYTLTVSSTERRGKVRCDFPFSIEEVQQTLCAASAAEHQLLRPGTKIEVYGQGNRFGLVVEGYRLQQ
jgi:hypothetical protein